MYGFWGKVLYVDLTAYSVGVKPFDELFFKKYLGGVGIATKILFDEVNPSIDPLSPDNAIVFAVGPFQGTTIPGSGRWVVASRSPLTGIWADSCAGGNWGPVFKCAGFDALVVRGRSESPSYLWICDDKVEIRDASRIWGKTTSETDRDIKADLGEPKAKVACIGPAGERLVKFASIVNEHGIAGRCGLGAVMGSKNLKAVAVMGTKRAEVAKPGELIKYSKALFKEYYDNTVNTVWRKYGTTSSIKKYYDRGYGLAENMRKRKFDKIDGLDGEHFLSITANPVACTYCPIACHRHTKIKEPKKYAYDGYGPEYQSIAMLGWDNLISDAKAVAYMGHLCDDYGIDTITMGSLLAFTTECYEKGWVTEHDLDGMKISWGDADAAISLIHKTAKREGFGGVLAEGIVKAAKHVGHSASKIAVHCKGLDYPAHDARAFYPAVINFATGTRGACHQRGVVTWYPAGIILPEWGISGFELHPGMEKAANIAVKYQDWAVLSNCLIQCEFMVFGGLTLTHQINLLRYVTGWNADSASMARIAERVFNLQRCLDVHYGISKKDDSAPDRVFEPLEAGPCAGKVPLPFDRTLMEYYGLRGWDSDGKPTTEKLVELGLTEALPPSEIQAQEAK